jgi:hypothetical protein
MKIKKLFLTLMIVSLFSFSTKQVEAVSNKALLFLLIMKIKAVGYTTFFMYENSKKPQDNQSVDNKLFEERGEGEENKKEDNSRS